MRGFAALARSDAGLKTGGPQPSGHDEGSEGLEPGEGPLHMLSSVVKVRRETEPPGSRTGDPVLVGHRGEHLALGFGGRLDEDHAC